jgi:4,5-dihydroxyphthalate decarboxylase
MCDQTAVETTLHAEPKTALKTVLGSYPHTLALKSGMLNSPDVTLDFIDVEPVHKAFAPMVRRAEYDLCELAIVTALQAVAYGKPVVVLPAVVASRLQRGCIIYHRPHGVMTPEALVNARVGVRAYTQTTGMWVRAHLAEDYGLPIERMRWVTSDPAHVEEYSDPLIVVHTPGDKSLPDMLRDGDIDAAILGNDLPKDPEFAPVIADHAAVDAAWYAKHGFMPINHMVVVSQELARKRPEAVRAAYALLKQADAEAPEPADGRKRTMFGLERLREPVELALATCARQQLLPRSLSFDEVFADAQAILGDLGV